MAASNSTCLSAAFPMCAATLAGSAPVGTLARHSNCLLTPNPAGDTHIQVSPVRLSSVEA
jgi:hypothetical protein